MELVLTTQDLQPLPEPIVLEKYIKPEGILNSNYKVIAKENLKNTTSKSIFAIKQRIKSRQYQITSGIETALKVSVFALIFLIIF
ncbi:hypothetical protein MBM09_05445 [Flaviramulus sp. BrNp1-15]|uniref:hypothetical protein n=1 Tax=Flaviramulus sp. BrNp1-15 TaxID=2916754 RepID=UPI001EE961EB|nr:hypothetical protein [Flaviramulus sp. BrNp1-15]ULC60431.1 hypothetical protein MBM09_05445 [Flaviramulus sp. BrNp1-15]